MIAISKALWSGSLSLLACAWLSASALAEESAAPKAAPVAAPAAPPVEVIFTGFARRADKGASVFVRMTAEVPVAAERAGKRVTYRLAGAKLGVANNGNPLPTEHFGAAVSNVALVPSSSGVDLVLDLTGAPDASIPAYRFMSQGGLATLHVELPPAPEAN